MQTLPTLQERPPNSSSGRRTATVGLLIDRPGAVSYLGTNSDCKCVEPGGNSYTISEQFGENKKASGTIIENEGTVSVNYDNGNPNGDGYEINTGIYATKRICCNPQNNVIRSASTLLSRAYYSDTTGYLKSRCKTYQQNASINRSANVQYTGGDKELLWPTSSATGPQVYRTNDTYQPRVNPYACNNTGGASTVIFKPNNRQYSVQGAVDSSTRMERLNVMRSIQMPIRFEPRLEMKQQARADLREAETRLFPEKQVPAANLQSDQHG